MARRFRYAFAKKKEAPLAKFSLGLLIASLLLMLAAVLASFFMGGNGGAVTGGLCLFAAMLSFYGFIQGFRSFSGENYSHKYSTIASIANGLLTIIWIGIYLLGL